MRYAFLGLALPLLVACGPPYEFVHHTEPSPFVRPGCRLVVEPIHSDQLVVGEKPEAQYVAEKKAESADSYDNDKRTSDQLFHQRIMDAHGDLFLPGAPDNTFVIRPMWVHWEPGSYFSKAKANLVVDVMSPTNVPLDRISIETSAGDYSSGRRMRIALRKAGGAVSAYIDDNWMCARH